MITAYRIDLCDEHGKNWYGFVAAPSEHEARTLARSFLLTGDRLVAVQGPFRKHAQDVMNG